MENRTGNREKKDAPEQASRWPNQFTGAVYAAAKREYRYGKAVFSAHRFLLGVASTWLCKRSTEEVLTLIIAVSTTVYAVVAAWQLSTMNTTLAEIRRQSVAAEAQSEPLLTMQSMELGDTPMTYIWELSPRPNGEREVGPPYTEAQQEIRFNIQNVGRGMAYSITTEAYWQRMGEEFALPADIDRISDRHFLHLHIGREMLKIDAETAGSGFMPKLDRRTGHGLLYRV